MTQGSAWLNHRIARSMELVLPESDRVAPINWQMKTLGGLQYWNDVCHRRGWRIQENAVTGHFRLLNPSDLRVAWGRRGHCEAELASLIRQGKIQPNAQRVVILLHGLLGTTRRMADMEIEFSAANEFQPINVAYSSTQNSVAKSAAFLRQLIDNLGPDVEEIYFVGHSLGNIVIRRYLNEHKDERIRRIVMLGPPNQGSRLARIFRNNILFKAAAGRGGQELSNDWEKLQPTLATPKCEFGIIAGAQNESNGFNNLLLEGKDDWTVSLAETRLAGAHDTYRVAAFHGHLVSHPEAIKATERFLKFGYFKTPNRKPIPLKSGMPNVDSRADSRADSREGEALSAPSNQIPESGRIAGIDYGLARIGIAVCDPSQTFSSPLEVYQVRNERLDAKHFQELARKESLVGFVIGLPVHMSGDESEMSLAARDWGNWLGGQTELPVVFVDERYTTAQAREVLNQSQLSGKKRKAQLDKLAAHILLATYLEQRLESEPESID